ncbi:hypothetical protein HRR83_008801 [Exophiala dermatitidis]|uniref:Uncharacterized protein n=2 Tax=Exophiala dermatitidis TaxID=5970 RepID=H6BX68_EXODN|nr:uncharacterized protein HMPREF1120_03495 [Exophiala dermatitidis NIH/UT8656]KAJ4503717.1 hypothetical protein HRR73_009022 [Exophiala dermatitidis]EHY55354.1 hypothetical protein HMPREF1120_03495 [Exophiala dermatitidis NIH/UT8656]KAJ4506234.1 hypothetical protein HRR75_007089 [Exophiala dermatitidis]KAJ4508329.1 hypothetical protein HRR74_007728 [Exophiala dermatitidis]KAJ4533454.1 hypothetical protein HRR77_008615 [Exophiala dermatitidis]
MAKSVDFSNKLSDPCCYHWGYENYRACPVCVRAHELRTCDGETFVSFHLCERHAETRYKGNMEDWMLTYVRTLVHPYYSPIYSQDTTCKKPGMEISLSTNDRPPFDRNNPAECWDQLSKSQQKNRKRRRPKLTAPAVLVFPEPKVTWAHAKGCFHSDKPDVVIKNKDEVELMDQFAKQRLQNINDLLNGPIDAILDDHMRQSRDLIYNRIAQEEREDKLYHDEELSREYEAFSGVEVNNPLIDPNDSAQVDEVGGDDRIADNKKTSGQNRDKKKVHPLIQAFEEDAKKYLVWEKARLEALIPLSSVAKAFYFKRCNGEYRNGVQDILVRKEPVLDPECRLTTDPTQTEAANPAEITETKTYNDGSVVPATSSSKDVDTRDTKGHIDNPSVSSSEVTTVAIGHATVSGADLGAVDPGNTEPHTITASAEPGPASVSAKEITTTAPTTTTRSAAETVSETEPGTFHTAATEFPSSVSSSPWVPISLETKNFGYAVLKPSREPGEFYNRELLYTFPQAEAGTTATSDHVKEGEIEGEAEPIFTAEAFHSLPPRPPFKFTTRYLLDLEDDIVQMREKQGREKVHGSSNSRFGFKFGFKSGSKSGIGSGSGSGYGQDQGQGQPDKLDEHLIKSAWYAHRREMAAASVFEAEKWIVRDPDWICHSRG